MQYRSNLNKVLQKLTNNLGVRNTDAMAREMALALYASQIDRIHGKGLNKALQPIGKYSTRPAYIEVDPFKAKAVNMGKAYGGRKRGRSTFGSGEKHERRYFPDGYKGFKAYLGYPTDHINLVLTKKLKEDTKMQKVDNGHYVIGFDTQYGAEISAKNEEHFKCTIWGVTIHDQELISMIARQFINKVQRA